MAEEWEITDRPTGPVKRGRETSPLIAAVFATASTGRAVKCATYNHAQRIRRAAYTSLYRHEQLSQYRVRQQGLFIWLEKK